MGAKPGTKPAPSAVQRLKGSYKKNPARENKQEPKAPKNRPKRGKELIGNKVAIAKHKQVVAWVASMDLESEVDSDIVDRYCLAWSRMVEANNLYKKHGLTLPTAAGGEKPNPACREFWAANVQLDKLQAHLGFGASNRVSLKAHQKEETDPFLEFLKRQKSMVN